MEILDMSYSVLPESDIEAYEKEMDYQFLPAAWVCKNEKCENFDIEYLVREKFEACPKCHVEGDYVRALTSGLMKIYNCGGCPRIVHLPNNHHPIGELGWGHIQVTNKHKFNIICPKCMDEIIKRFPTVNVLDKTLSSADDYLPKIKRPSKEATK